MVSVAVQEREYSTKAQTLEKDAHDFEQLKLALRLRKEALSSLRCSLALDGNFMRNSRDYHRFLSELIRMRQVQEDRKRRRIETKTEVKDEESSVSTSPGKTESESTSVGELHDDDGHHH